MQVSVEQAMRTAIEHHQAGRFAEAEALYRQVLDRQPNHSTALHRLGAIAHQVGRHDVAVDLIGQAIAITPQDATFHCNLGEALRCLGRLDEAVTAYTRSIQLDPNCAEVHSNLGNVLRLQDRIDEAVAACLKAIQIKPDYAPAYNNLGSALHVQGRNDEAVKAFLTAIRLCPDFALAFNNMSISLSGQGRQEEAIAACFTAIRLQPNYPEAFFNLGYALSAQGKLDDAVVAYAKALQLKPNYTEACINLGSVMKDKGEITDALATYAKALSIDPTHLGAASNHLFTLHLHPDADPASLYEEHRLWNQKYAHSMGRYSQAHRGSSDSKRRLKIGYVSPDFRDHPVGRFLLPLLRHHDKTAVEIFCYSDTRTVDQITERLRDDASTWRDIARLSDERVATLVHEDEIDILVDLAMHTAHNRMMVFARKPAPVQVSYLAYCSTTGLETIDYRLTDPYLDPPGLENTYYSEQSIRLPETYWCYQPAIATPDISSLPALTGGSVTFGCLNNFCKVSSASLETWCDILRKVPQSRLMLSAREGSHREKLKDILRREHVEPDRLRFINQVTTSEYFRLYQGIDIGLDPFPYTGGTTTCDALWMGVPVVTLAGRTAVGRAGVSILSNVGLQELIASSHEQYVCIAAALASDLQRLGGLRAELRTRMRQSPLMDAPRFARNIETAFRHMWRNWCDETAIHDPHE